MPIMTANPLLISEPENSYDRLFLSLSIGGVVTDNGKEIDSNVSVSMRRYRKLEDGTVEFAPRDKGDQSLSISGVFEAAKEDPDLAEIVGTIFGALAKYISVKGV